MSRIAVMIETDHEDSDEAARSVIINLKRAGYDYRDASMDEFVIQGDGTGVLMKVEALVEFWEPEIADANRD